MTTPDLNLAIDSDNLATEWQGQASLMLHWGQLLADAQLTMDQAKAKLAVVSAELSREIRESPAEFGIDKITETTATNAVLEQREHQVANKVYMSARYNVAMLRAAVDAIEHRKKALEKMADLWLRQYYADPTSNGQPAELQTAATTTEKKTIRTRGRKRKVANG